MTSNLLWVLCAAQQSCFKSIHSSTSLDTIASLLFPQTATSSQKLILHCGPCFPLTEKMQAARRDHPVDAQHHIYPPLASVHPDTSCLAPHRVPGLPSKTSPSHSQIPFPLAYSKQFFCSPRHFFPPPMDHSISIQYAIILPILKFFCPHSPPTTAMFLCFCS